MQTLEKPTHSLKAHNTFQSIGPKMDPSKKPSYPIHSRDKQTMVSK